MKKHLHLFFTMLKIGLFTFGGGYGMLALLENELVTKKKWLEKEEFIDMVAIAESTPGPLAVNAATYIGYRLYGFSGALLSTVAVCIPSFVIIYLISLFFDACLSFASVAYAFRGIQIAVVWLILSAGWKMLRETEKKPLSVLLFVGVAACTILFSLFSVGFSSVFYILICGAVGLFAYVIGRLSGKEKK